MRQRREEIARRYNEAFASCPEIETPTVREHVGHAWHLYMLRLNGDSLSIGRDEFIVNLKKRNIGSSVHFIPLHVQPYYQATYGYQPEDLPVAFREYRREISLPIYSKMTDSDVQSVIDAVTEIIREFSTKPLMRLLDVSISLLGLIVLSPVLLVVAVAVKCSSPGPCCIARAGSARRPAVYSLQVSLDGGGCRRSWPRVTAATTLASPGRSDPAPNQARRIAAALQHADRRHEPGWPPSRRSGYVSRTRRAAPGASGKARHHKPATVLHRHEEQMLSGPDWEETYRREILPAKLRIELDYLSRRTLSKDVLILAQTASALFTKPARLGANRGSQCRS